MRVDHHGDFGDAVAVWFVAGDGDARTGVGVHGDDCQPVDVVDCAQVVQQGSGQCRCPDEEAAVQGVRVGPAERFGELRRVGGQDRPGQDGSAVPQP